MTEWVSKFRYHCCAFCGAQFYVRKKMGRPGTVYCPKCGRAFVGAGTGRRSSKTSNVNSSSPFTKYVKRRN